MQGRGRTTMRVSTATVRQILLGCLLMGVCAPVWARFQPVSCKNAFTEQQEIAEGDNVAAQVYPQMPVLPDSCRCRSTYDSLGRGWSVMRRGTSGLMRFTWWRVRRSMRL